jgi:hypothetical protein
MTEISMIREIDNLLMSFQRQNKVYISEIPGEQNSLKEKLRDLIKLQEMLFRTYERPKSRKTLHRRNSKSWLVQIDQHPNLRLF